MAAREVRRFLEELEHEKGEEEEEGGRGKKGGLESVVFCVFEAKDERAYGEWLPYVYLIQRFPRMEGDAEQKKSNPSFLSI